MAARDRPDLSGRNACRDIRSKERDLDDLDIDEFETAEEETKKILSGSRYIHRQDVQFMRHVKSKIEKFLPDQTGSFDKTKGRWVPQKEFLEKKKIWPLSFAVRH